MNWNYQQQRYFLYDPEGDGMQYFDSVDDRDKAAAAAIKDSHSNDGWGEEVINIVVGEVTHSAQEYDRTERPPDAEIDEDGYDQEGDWWDSDWTVKCNYKMMPINTPTSQDETPDQSIKDPCNE